MTSLGVPDVYATLQRAPRGIPYQITSFIRQKVCERFGLTLARLDDYELDFHLSSVIDARDAWFPAKDTMSWHEAAGALERFSRRHGYYQPLSEVLIYLTTFPGRALDNPSITALVAWLEDDIVHEELLDILLARVLQKHKSRGLPPGKLEYATLASTHLIAARIGEVGLTDQTLSGDFERFRWSNTRIDPEIVLFEALAITENNAEKAARLVDVLFGS